MSSWCLYFFCPKTTWPHCFFYHLAKWQNNYCTSLQTNLVFIAAEDSNLYHFWLDFHGSFYKEQQTEKQNIICLHIIFDCNHWCHWQCTAIDCDSNKITVIWMYSGCNWQDSFAVYTANILTVFSTGFCSVTCATVIWLYIAS